VSSSVSAKALGYLGRRLSWILSHAEQLDSDNSNACVVAELSIIARSWRCFCAFVFWCVLFSHHLSRSTVRSMHVISSELTAFSGKPRRQFNLSDIQGCNSPKGLSKRKQNYLFRSKMTISFAVNITSHNAQPGLSDQKSRFRSMSIRHTASTSDRLEFTHKVENSLLTIGTLTEWMVGQDHRRGVSASTPYRATLPIVRCLWSLKVQSVECAS
jgi:hypothetical protein